MLEPAHASTDRESVFDKRVVECLPPSAVDAVMRKSPPPGNGKVATIGRYDGTLEGPLIEQVGRRYSRSVPQRGLRGDGSEIREVIAPVYHNARVRLEHRAEEVCGAVAACDDAPSQLE